MDEGGEEPRRNESSPHVPIVRFAPGGRGAMFVRVGFVETSDGECSGVREPPYPTCVVCQRDRGEHYAGMGMAIAASCSVGMEPPEAHQYHRSRTHRLAAIGSLCAVRMLVSCQPSGAFFTFKFKFNNCGPLSGFPLFLFFFVSTPLYATGVGWMGWIGQSVAAVTAPAVRLVVSSCA